MYAHGWPPERETAELLEPAVGTALSGVRTLAQPTEPLLIMCDREARAHHRHVWHRKVNADR